MAEGIAPSSRPALSEVQLEGLRAAFAHEVAERLEPLAAAAALLVDAGSLDAARVVVSHTHTLASSAVIVGEDLAAFHARRCEQALHPHVESGTDPIPREVAEAAAGEVSTLGVLLGPWLLRDGDHGD